MSYQEETAALAIWVGGSDRSKHLGSPLHPIISCMILSMRSDRDSQILLELSRVMTTAASDQSEHGLTWIHLLNLLD